MSAFTLLELLIVLTIIGILMAIGLATFGKLQDTANIKAIEVEISQFKIAIYSYKMDNGGSVPTSVDDLLAKGYIKNELATDPWGSKYVLIYNSSMGTMTVISPGPDKKQNTKDDVTREIDAK